MGTASGNFTNGQTVVIDSVNKKILVQSGDQLIGLDSLIGQTGTAISTPPAVETPKVETPKAPETPNPLTMELSQGTELEKAIYWMHKNGLTQYDTLSAYRPQDPLLREEATKIIGQAYNILWFSKENKNHDCNFSDRETFNPTLASYIASTCSYGIFKGSQGKFLAQNPLTKAEALTVLIRILEGKSSKEDFSPWRTVYFIKAKGISLTKEAEVNAQARAITREEIALLIYRFKTIILNQQLNQAAKSQLSLIDTNPQQFLVQTQSGSLPTIITGNMHTDNNFLGVLSGANTGSTSTLSILNSPEVVEAIQRMRDHGLTNAKDIASYAPFETLTREQAAKMFAQFAKALNFSALSGAVSCNFSDLAKADISLKTSIQEACALGLMQGNKGAFEPKIWLTKAQFTTMLIRLAEGKRLDENVNPRRANYFLKAKELWILNAEDAASFESQLTRYEAALLFYRFQLKQKISSGLNTEKHKNELISTIKNTDGSFATGDIEGAYAVALDANLLKNQFFQEGFVEFLGTRYALKKTTMTVFDLGEESFVWYGDLVDIAKETKAWTINFVLSNGSVIQATMRLNEKNETWLIKESRNTTAWFNAVKG